MSDTAAATTSASASVAPVAQRVCAAGRDAAAAALPARVTVRVADPDPANTECLLSARGIRIDLVAQQSPRAWAQFDTTAVHQVQAYGNGDRRNSGQMPVHVLANRVQADWIPAQNEMFATNGTQSRGGSYVTVTVKGGHVSGRVRLRLAQAVTVAALRVAPRGPNLVPPS